MKKKKLKTRMLRWAALNLAPPLVHVWMKLFNWTALRNHERDLTVINTGWLQQRVASHEGVIVTLWHNRLMYGPTSYQYMKGRLAAIMVSRSFDGELILAVLRRFQMFQGVRGSSAKKPGQDKGGQDALKEMIELGKQKVDLVITPDGPQGPPYKVKRGVIALAKETGLPIVPGAPGGSRYLELRSWDRTRIPLPFARFIYEVGDPIWVPADASEEEMERLRQELERKMVEMTEHVDNYYNGRA